MKPTSKSVLFILLCIFNLQLFAQEEETWKEAIIFEFTAPYDQITINFDDEDFVFEVNDKTAFLLTKKKSIPKNKIYTGSTVDISFIIKNRKRVLTKVMVSSEDYGKQKKFEGVFESYSDGVAIVDGRKVQLTNKTSLKCNASKDCNCSKGRSFLGFDELTLGSFLTVSGEVNSNGTYAASKIEVCKNMYTKSDEELMSLVSKSFDASNLTKVKTVPNSTYNPAYGLHGGKIKIGSIEYKLLDDIRVQGYINMVGNRVLPEYAKEDAYAKKHEVYFRFYVIENEVPNASAFPNGMIFIHTGLLKLMKNEAQLASVLGHEIAHVTYEHGAKRYKTTKITNSGLGKKGVRWLKKTFKKKVKVEEGSILGDALDKALEYTTPENIINIFDKGKETQSDRVGLFYMKEAGYDPREAANFWQLMMANTKNEKFMSKIFNNALDMVTNVEGELDEINFKVLGKDGTDMLVETILETVYTSHPLSVKRFGDINRLLSTTYENTDFSQTETGKIDFEKYLKTLK